MAHRRDLAYPAQHNHTKELESRSFNLEEVLYDLRNIWLSLINFYLFEIECLWSEIVCFIVSWQCEWQWGLENKNPSLGLSNHWNICTELRTCLNLRGRKSCFPSTVVTTHAVIILTAASVTPFLFCTISVISPTQLHWPVWHSNYIGATAPEKWERQSSGDYGDYGAIGTKTFNKVWVKTKFYPANSWFSTHRERWVHLKMKSPSRQIWRRGRRRKKRGRRNMRTNLMGS